MEKESNETFLSFKLTLNQSVEVPFKEQRMPLTRDSIAGHVALSGEEVCLEDAYHLPADASYTFDSSFDKCVGYRTHSLVAIPMTDQQGHIVGVLEFINRKYKPDQPLTADEDINEQVLAFDTGYVSLLRALASQAAVAIENRRLLDDIKALFDGFVKASVFAIEQRDPTTSGHSFRVADLCEALAGYVNVSSHPTLKSIDFSEHEMRELRFAALLHDFGKVGVRENVLTKAKKLYPERLEILHYRIALAKSQRINQAQAEILSLLESHGHVDTHVRQRIEADAQHDIQQMENFLQIIIEANEPHPLDTECSDQLQKIQHYAVEDHQGKTISLLSDDDYSALSIKRGSLTPQEREEIESHVNHTVSFLSLIPWTEELSNIPRIAGAHHEKLDGSGYPHNLNADQIPVQTRIMTICDIFDALTAADRPYKSALPIDKALDIISAEVKRGLLDENLVRVFIDSQCYKVLEGKKYGTQANWSNQTPHAHHVCDFDLEHHNHIHQCHHTDDTSPHPPKPLH